MPMAYMPAPEGRLEGKYSAGETDAAPIALILHPHPLYGGTMNNKCVYAMYKTFREHGFATLRFNYRGVGRSDGSYDNGEGELTDAACALDWMQSQFPNSQQCWVAGFSFGALIGMQLLMRRPESQGFISIAPPVSLYDFSFLAPCPTSGLIIHGSEDELTPPEDIHEMVANMRTQKDVKVETKLIEGADHFFTKNISDITELLSEYLTEHHKPI